jgi:hypothetical protein
MEQLIAVVDRVPSKPDTARRWEEQALKVVPDNTLASTADY